jgi:hypothetical protein
MKKIFIFILILAILIPISIRAADEYTLLEPLPCIEGTGNTCTAGATSTPTMNIETYIGYIFKFAIAISAFLAIIMIIYGGFEIMLSEAVPAKMDGKERIKNAIFGLIMVLASYLILRTIDPRLVEINTRIAPIDTARLIAEMKDFHEKLNSDINNSVRINNASSKASLEQLDRLNNYKQQLEDTLEMANITDNERDFFEAELEQATRSINSVKSEKNLSEANSSGLSHFKRATSIINNPNADSSDLATLNSEYLNQDSMSTSVYTTYQAKILDAESRRNTAESDLLIKQRDFFINQIKEEKILKDKIITHKTTGVVNNSGSWSPTSVGEINNTVFLESYIEESRNELINPTKIVGTGIDPVVYTTMLQTRIDKLNKALNK